MTAYCAAEQFDIGQVAHILRSRGYKLDPYDTKLYPHVVHVQLPVDSALTTSESDGALSGDVFIYPSGTLVAWNVPEEPMINLATEVLHQAAENSHPNPLETEDLEYVEDHSREFSGMKGDTIFLGTKSGPAPQPEHHATTTLAKVAFSSGLARSTKLAVLESLLNAYFTSTRSIPPILSAGQALPFTRSFMLQKTGQLLSIRAQLNLYSELTDSLPDLFWDSRHELGLERFYDQVGRALDVGVRIKTLNEKMDYSQEIASVLRAQLSEQHGNRLEWIIIALITIEVGFEVRRIYREYDGHAVEAH